MLRRFTEGTFMRLKDKVAIVTGGGSGFGEGICRRFAIEGAKVVVNDINDSGGERVAAAIRIQRGEARYVRADVARADDVKAMVKATVDAFGRVDIMVNNAGFTHRNRSMLEIDEATYERIFDVNVRAIFLAAREVIPVFRKQGAGGVILNTASTAGLRPRPGLTLYNASKGAAITMTKSMAVEFAPDKIRVNCLCPVIGDTGMTVDFMGVDTPERRAQFAATIPLGRFSTPADIASAALYLCSDEASMITGTAFEIDGGRCI
jgi:3-oxoacyl-[acyl-carrier protein] reductase